MRTLLPMLAAIALLATAVQPVHKHARLITLAALIEYAVAGFFAVVFGFLIGLVKIAGWSARVAFEEFLVRVAWLAVFLTLGLGIYVVALGLTAPPAVNLGPAITVEEGPTPSNPSPSSVTPTPEPTPTAPSPTQSSKPPAKPSVKPSPKPPVLPSKSAPVKPLPPSKAYDDDDDDDDDGDDGDDGDDDDD